MKKVLAMIACALFAVSFPPPAKAQDIWAGKDGNIRNVDTRAMIIDQGELYLATRSEIYRARDAKDKWESIFTLPQGENEISSIGGSAKNILAGTRRGLYRSQDYGKTWRNVFRTIIPGKNSILCIENSKYNPRKVFIGTERGIFASVDSGDNWQDISGCIKGRRVSSIALNKDSAFARADDGLYFKPDTLSDWERIYVHRNAEETAEDVFEEAPYDAENGSGVTVNCLMLKGSRLYAGVGKKIIFSDDNGKSWRDLSDEGLTGTINYIASVKKRDSLYCATSKGVFEFKDGRWMELYKGADRIFNVNSIVSGDEEENFLWALTDKGLYRLESGKYASDQYIDVERNLKGLKIIFDNEPAFKELQRAAMRFAEVDPEKIRKMRSEARLKALLPKVSVGLDKKRSTNSEIYTSATKDYVIMGPDDENDGLDVSVSWELADLIWSDDQTNIDVRSRLTTQLRNDILDDLRRAYYERKRLQFDTMTAPPKEMKARFDKELRIQELTQAIDDLTGNYLSEHMKITDANE
ncbi:MAG: hypothetical protein WC592_05115 [Candidatus Omnitrophota bacterium]